jgi:hypothetical protein
MQFSGGAELDVSVRGGRERGLGHVAAMLPLSLFTIVAFPLSWSLCCILSGVKPLHILNSSVGSLKVVDQ